MILTVTPDPVLDKILFIDEWTPGIPMVAQATKTSVGGKGLDSSVVLSHLGVPSVGLTFLAGEPGKELASLIEAYGIELEAVWAEGSTRTAHIISEAQHQRHSHVFSGGLQVQPNQLTDFIKRYSSRLGHAQWVICGGVVPACLQSDFYRPLITAAVDSGIPVLIDAYQDFVLQSLSARPDIVKMNRHEFQKTYRLPAGNLEMLFEQGRQIYQQQGLKALVITCGEAGILAYCSEGIFQATPPKLSVVNAAGAGDAASAALAWRFSTGENWPSALKWAAAVSAAAVLTEGTADCHLEDVQAILPQVSVRKIAE